MNEQPEVALSKSIILVSSSSSTGNNKIVDQKIINNTRRRSSGLEGVPNCTDSKGNLMRHLRHDTSKRGILKSSGNTMGSSEFSVGSSVSSVSSGSKNGSISGSAEFGMNESSSSIVTFSSVGSNNSNGSNTIGMGVKQKRTSSLLKSLGSLLDGSGGNQSQASVSSRLMADTVDYSDDEDRVHVFHDDKDSFYVKRDLAPTAPTATATTTKNGESSSSSINVNATRKSKNNDNSSSHNKHHVSDDLICPITHELPFNPVTAEDGFIYERRAIEQHIQSKGKRTSLKSPITNERIGKRLLPAVQQKNLIQTLVDSGVITGDLAKNWNQKREVQQSMDLLLKIAESGKNTKAMVKIAHQYASGNICFAPNKKLAFMWYRRAHVAGDVLGTALTGRCLVEGTGTAPNSAEGFVYLTSAAEQGSDVAAFNIGFYFAKGACGLPCNKRESIVWLEKCLGPSCTLKNLTATAKKQAKEQVQEMRAEQKAMRRRSSTSKPAV